MHVRYGGQEATSRDMVLGALAQWGHASESVKVAFVDVQVTFDGTRPDAATAYLSATITGRDSVDAREADVRLAKIDGKWVVTAAETKGDADSVETRTEATRQPSAARLSVISSGLRSVIPLGRRTNAFTSTSSVAPAAGRIT